MTGGGNLRKFQIRETEKEVLCIKEVRQEMIQGS